MAAIAPLVAAFRRRLGNLPGPVRASGEASNGEPVVVELLVAGVWTDITAYVMVRDDSGSVRITYGIQGGEGSQTERGQATLQLKNGDGRFSPRNPTGAYYDSLNWRNAQMRVSVPDGNGGKCYLIWGEVSEWAPNWDSTGSDVWTDVTVNGILQRLAQGPVPERSIIYRAVTDPELTSLLAYWPCEDPEGSTEIASALVNGSPMTITGSPGLASYEGFGASDPLPTLTGASLTGGVAKYDVTAVTQYQMRFLLAVPKAGFSDVDVLARLQVAEVASGAFLLNYFDIHYNDPPGGVGSYGGPGTLTIQPRDGDESAIGANASTTLDVRGRLLRVSLENSISGSTITSTLRVLDINSGVTDSASATVLLTSMSRVVSMSLAPATLAGSAGVTGAAAGHLLLQNTITDIEDLGRAIQPTGEAAGRRIERLCAEDGIPFGWVGDLDDTAALGAQPKQNLLTLVQEAVLADGGLLYENTSVLGLGYRTRASLYGQDPALTLSYTGFNLNEVPIPVSDDRYVQNRVTVTVDGVSQSYEETSGPLGTEAIGVYGENTGLTLNLATTDANTLRDQAAWRVHLGTVEDERFPQITVHLNHPSITPEMRRAILALRLGDRVQMTGMPGWLAPDTVEQLILGKDQTITHFEHRVTLTCAPASPYNLVGVLDGGEARLDIETELVSAAASSDTALAVAPPAGETLLWTTDSTNWPFDVRLGGEVARVTAVGSWATDTFTRSVSGGWGTADTGQAWSVVGGVVGTDFSVSGTYGVHVLTTVNVSRRCGLEHQLPDVDVYISLTTSATATGGSLYGGPVARYIDANNMYFTRVEFTTGNAVLVDLRKRVAGTESSLGTYTTGLTHVAGTYVRCRLQVVGTLLRTKVWAAASSEPVDWQVEVRDTSHNSSNYVGGRSITAASNTNVNPEVRYDDMAVVSPQNLTVTRSVNGVTKAHTAGTAVSLAYPTPLAL